MANIDSHSVDIGFADRLSSQDTPIHRLDPRAKLLTTLCFIVAVVSFGRYEIAALLPFFVFPVVLVAMGNVPAAFLLRRMLLVAPFAVLLGIFNPFLDRSPFLIAGGLVMSGGWVSFISMLVKFVLTVGAALILLACTGIHRVCLGLERLGVPRVFTVQLLFLHRYLFVLVEEGLRMVRARAARSFGRNGMSVHVYSNMLGSLLLRTLDRAQRIHLAMSCRGFDGHIRTIRSLAIQPADMVFVGGWAAFFLAARLYNLPRLLGSFVMEVLR